MPATRLLALAGALALGMASPARAQAPAADASRGELLYTTHCIACHTSQMHWRDKRQVTDWASLTANVRRWQAQTGQRWSDDDIAAVARHLNQRYYRLPDVPSRVAAAPAH
jgi:mono/diheme cytochrome c family protein